MEAKESACSRCGEKAARVVPAGRYAVRGDDVLCHAVIHVM